MTALITKFFEQDNLQQLTLDVGIFLDCPLLVLDNAFRVVAHFCPVGFSDPLFRSAVSQGASDGVVTYSERRLWRKCAKYRSLIPRLS